MRGSSSLGYSWNRLGMCSSRSSCSIPTAEHSSVTTDSHQALALWAIPPHPVGCAGGGGEIGILISFA